MQFSQFTTPIIALILLLASRSAFAGDPPHLKSAVDLIVDLDPAHNEYAYDDIYIHWKNVDGAQQNEVRADCSGFVSLIFQHVYHYSDEDLKKWFGHKRPLARHYFDTIDAGTGFEKVAHVQDIRAGDLLAVKYGDESKAGKDTGHVMIVAAAPRPRKASAPLQGDSKQWEISVIDSSKSGHGPLDTRHKADKTFGTGAGEGAIRVYADEQGNIIGYTWSTLSKSEFYSQEKHHLVVGRLKDGFKP